jgi:ferredoxin--NADP+ reductase
MKLGTPYSPAEVLGRNGKVIGLRTKRTELLGDGHVRGTGEFHDWDVWTVLRAVGYLSSQLAELPFDHITRTVPNQAGRCSTLDETHLPGVCVTGWIKRGRIGLIGHTKGDAAETIARAFPAAERLSWSSPAKSLPSSASRLTRRTARPSR